jgi:hypothetical protein
MTQVAGFGPDPCKDFVCRACELSKFWGKVILHVPDLCLSCDDHIIHEGWSECVNYEGGLGDERSTRYAYLNAEHECDYYKEKIIMKTEDEAKQWIIRLGREGKTFDEVLKITSYNELQVAKIWPVVLDYHESKKPKDETPKHISTTRNDNIRPFLSQELVRKLDDPTLTWVDKDLLEYSLANILWIRLQDCSNRDVLIDAIMSDMFDS